MAIQNPTIAGSAKPMPVGWDIRDGIDPASVRYPDFAPRMATFTDVVRHRAEATPDTTLYTFYDDDGGIAGSYTCAELDRKARAIAAHLTARGAKGERALLLYAPGLDYIAAFYGCMYAGVVAVPAYPPDLSWLERSLPRLSVIADDAQPKFALTTEIILSAAESMFDLAPNFRSMEWIATDQVEDTRASDWQMPSIDSASLAFLQYTSGSTRDPKGVMLTHENLLANALAIHNAFDIQAESTATIWLPPYHDMGLIGGIMQPVYSELSVNLMSPFSFLRRPMYWLEMVSKTGASIAGGPNFAYDFCVRRSTPEERAALDLSAWRIAFNGAEPIRPETFERFADAFACAGFNRSAFFTCYGMAETTLYVSGGMYRESQRPVSCGKVAVNADVRIVDPGTREACAPGEEGEIWVHGPSVAQGYWNQPEVNAETFGVTVAGGDGTGYLRTGDLGLLREGECFVTGRRKDLIVIRGTNHYPQDIEFTVEHAHPALRRGCVAAFSIDIEGEERLAIVQEVQSTVGDSVAPDEVFGAIRREVARAHELHVHGIALIPPRQIAKTSSGKIQRQASRSAYLADSMPVVAKSEDRPADSTIETPSVSKTVKNQVDFSLLYFANESDQDNDAYRLYIEGAKYADEHGFAAIWTPERHFHPFGGLYPNPSVLSAALAMVTSRIRLRAGSVVLPLHDPVRVAEEWAVVDQLSNGRVDLAFAQGWNANDFVLAADAYENRKHLMYKGIETIHRLWRGESVTLRNGHGEDREVRVYPLPKQREHETWITCSGGPERFAEAGAGGFHVLTALLFQEVDALAEKLAMYRQARADHGHDPDAGHVTVMLHTYIDDDLEAVRDRVREPFKDYLESSVDLWRNESDRLEGLSRREREELLEFAFERYFQTTALMGTPDSCSTMVNKLADAGVDEIACLIDFGVERDAALNGLRGINTLRERFSGSTVANAETDDEAIVLRTSREASADSTASPDELITYLKSQIAETLETPPDTLSPDKHVMELGLDSIMVIQLIGDLQKVYGIRLHPREVFEHPTIGELAAYLSGQLNQSDLGGSLDIDILEFYPKASGSSSTALPPGAEKNEKAAFIFSTPRAGSTLLRVMLAGHPQLFCPPELHLLPFNTMASREQALADSFLGEGLERAYMELAGLSAKDARDLAELQGLEGWTTHRTYQFLQERAAGRMLVDKSPSYAADVANAHRADAWFESAKFVLLVRHPYAVIESMVRHRFHTMLGAGDSDPHAFAEHVWTVLNENMVRIAEEYGDDRCHWVRYEDLVAQPRDVMPGLCAFLGVPFDDAVLAPYEGRRMTDGVHAESVPLGDPDFHTHAGIDATLASRWETARPDRPLLAETVALAERLGYAVESPAPRTISAPAEFEEGRI